MSDHTENTESTKDTDSESVDEFTPSKGTSVRRSISRGDNFRKIIRHKTPPKTIIQDDTSPPNDVKPDTKTDELQTNEDSISQPGIENGTELRQRNIEKKESLDNDETPPNMEMDTTETEETPVWMTVGLTVYNLMRTACLMLWSGVLKCYEKVNELLDGNKEHTPTPSTVTSNGTKEETLVKDRLYHICHELMTTEESYVQKLGILVMVKEKADKLTSPETAKKMFSNIEVIHQFHRDNLLPQLQERMEHWMDHKGIGDIMKRVTPFLKLYTEYVKNFEVGSSLIDSYDGKSNAFGNYLKECKEKAECGRLRVQAHMLEPVQRVPRYELLLRDYLKRLPEDSPDRPDAEKAMQLVAEAAMHFENMMKRDTRISGLMKLQRQLDGNVNIVSGSNRELLKQGKIMTITRAGKPADRYVFLFNDMLIVCADQAFGVLGKYKVKVVVDLQDAQVADSINLDIPNSFLIKTSEMVKEFCTNTPEEKEEWERIIAKQIGECTKDKLLRHGNAGDRESSMKIDENKLGKEAPIWLHYSSTTMCMICAAKFGPIVRKRHCKTCGIVVCAKCSTHSVRLDYDKGKTGRVCDACFVILNEDSGQSIRIKVDKINPESLIQKGFLTMSSDAEKSWKKLWFAVEDTGMLHSFKAHQDISPLTSLTLESFVPELIDSSSKRGKVLRLKSEARTYFLYDENEESLRIWLSALEKVMTALDQSSIEEDGSSEN